MVAGGGRKAALPSRRAPLKPGGKALCQLAGGAAAGGGGEELGSIGDIFGCGTEELGEDEGTVYEVAAQVKIESAATIPTREGQAEGQAAGE